MSCQIQIDSGVQRDILDLRPDARREVGEFLLRLQDDPLPAGHSEMSAGAFYQKLPCGYWISWEVLGDLMGLALKGATQGLTVRVLGIAPYSLR
jgi:hypothetical protein